ncbi:MAG: hypothetical protein ACYDC1_01140 [Limisphaerales bacterium]
MNTTPRRVPTRFAPPTRFRVKPNATRSGRTALNAKFEGLKNRLIEQHLAEAADEHLGPALRRAAMDAAALAWVTAVPLLVLPELLQEKAVDARRRTARQAAILRRTRKLMGAAA